MMCRVRAPYAFVLAAAASAAVFSVPAIAADLPQIKQSKANAVPSCATPGRLMAFLDARNSKLDPKFATIASDYMRVGDDLQIRWDTAFFQMLLETGNLTFTGDVSPKQNNFAGLGATGKHEPGESFPDVPTGVKAHLEHLLMYAGEPLANPVAERTRKVQEWGVLTSWQKTIDGPMTYTQLAKKWAPGSRGYSRDIGDISEAFYNGLCTKSDPKPELLALAKAAAPDKTAAKSTTAATVAASADDVASTETETAPAKVSGADLARRAVEEARASGSFVRSSLGGGSLLGLADAAKTAATDAAAAAPPPAVKILNAPKPEADDATDVSAAPTAATVTVPPASVPPASSPGPSAKVQTAALGSGLGSGLKSAASPPAAAKEPARADTANSACKVWTASYGGARAVIIKANADSQDNYTVLDVNEGTEKREADAYIAAYAKGGKTVGEYTSTSQALDKAFELCPEG